MTDTPPEKLLPCPFCGVEPQIRRAVSDGQSLDEALANPTYEVKCAAPCFLRWYPTWFTLDEWNTRASHKADEGAVEAAARAICEASGDAWRVGVVECLTGPDFTMQRHSLDEMNNHWRHKATAAINAAYPLLVAENMRLRAFVDWTISKDFNSRDLPSRVAALTRDNETKQTT